jgi:hypothetical protein
MPREMKMNEKIKKGHLIQLKTWFNDVWAEVLAAYGNMVVYCAYDKHGTTRWTTIAFAKDIRRTTTKKKAPPGDIKHLARGKFGGLHPRPWPNRLGPDDRAHPNHPQRHPGCPAAATDK